MSIFPQYGNMFGGGHHAGRNELVSFNAGKMSVQSLPSGKFLISPELKKGKICLTRGDDQLLHFQWMDRQTGVTPDDFILFPDDATFSRVQTGRDDDRVYMLQYKNSSRRFFFWMQHKDVSRDEEFAKKVNDCMNNVTSSSGHDGAGGRSGAGGNVQLDHNAIMQMLGAMGAGGDHGRGGTGGANAVQMSELQSILQNMGLPAANSSSTSSPATSAASSTTPAPHSGGASSTATTTVSTHHHDVSGMETDEISEDELLRLAIEESMRDANPESQEGGAPLTASVAPSASTSQPFPAAPRGITAADFQRAMASVQAQAPKSISLSKILQPANLSSILNDETCVEQLVRLLPEGSQTPYELQATISSPQLRQSIASLISALQTGNFHAVLANFGLDPAAGASQLAYGDCVGAFLAAIQHWAERQHSTMSE